MNLITGSNLVEFRNLYDWFVKNKPSQVSDNFSPVHNDFQTYSIIVINANDINVVDWEGFKIDRPEIDIA